MRGPALAMMPSTAQANCSTHLVASCVHCIVGLGDVIISREVADLRIGGVGMHSRNYASDSLDGNQSLASEFSRARDQAWPPLRRG
jgi:hypothetical protein